MSRKLEWMQMFCLTWVMNLVIFLTCFATGSYIQSENVLKVIQVQPSLAEQVFSLQSFAATHQVLGELLSRRVLSFPMPAGQNILAVLAVLLWLSASSGTGAL